jgi:riboflavin kinase / FMN adenylyltransferase
MDLVHGLHELRPEHGPAFVVVGVFDGLHLGHRYLLSHLVHEARRRGARPAVVTFDHHPDEIVTGSAPPLLCDPDERVVHLARPGVALTVVQHFDQALRETSFESFVEMIRERAQLAGFLMTPESAFGYQRRGTPDALAALGSERGFDVVVVPPFELGGLAVRSSEVRTAIAAGDLATARRLLGRPHAVAGPFVPSPAGTGGAITFELPSALPPEGRYSGMVEPAWVLGRPRETPVRRVVTVEDRHVCVGSIPWSGRIRVAFTDRRPDRR